MTHYLLDTETVKTYLIQQLGLFAATEPLTAEEIGDGNINYVFRVRSEATGKSIIVKQADRLLRSSGRPLDLTRSKREAAALRIYATHTPQFIPQIYHYDEAMSTICMEDIGYCSNLRKKLMAGHPLPDQFAEHAAAFLAQAVFPSSGLFLPPEQKKAQVQAFINPELCAISETLVFSEPYCNGKNRNRITAGNEAFVNKMLYTDEALKAAVAALREIFMNNAEALIHGDLHTGSIFIGKGATDTSMKIIDPEFAFYGPIGYDLGNLIANLYFAWMFTVFTGISRCSSPSNAAYTAGITDCTGSHTGFTGMPHDGSTADTGAPYREQSLIHDNAGRIAAAIETLPALFTAKALEQNATKPLSDPIYNERYIRQRLRDICAEAYGFAGTEIIRRTVGDTKVAELEAMGNAKQRITAERILISTARMLIKQRHQPTIGIKAVNYFKRRTRIFQQELQSEKKPQNT